MRFYESPKPYVIFLALYLMVLSGLIASKAFRSTNDPYSGVLIVHTDHGQGSCFTVAQRESWYYAITAWHVTDGATSVVVDDERYEAEVVKVDPNEDVALIRFESSENYRLYSFARAQLGESCTSVGWSRDSKLVYKGHVVSQNFTGFVAANGGVVPGCSGGVLLNDSNEAIGVVVASPVYGFEIFDGTVLYASAQFAEALYITIGD